MIVRAAVAVFRPATPGPHPALALVSGCDGLTPPMAPALYERRAEHLRALGQIAIFVDYLGRRGLFPRQLPPRARRSTSSCGRAAEDATRPGADDALRRPSLGDEVPWFLERWIS